MVRMLGDGGGSVGVRIAAAIVSLGLVAGGWHGRIDPFTLGVQHRGAADCRPLGDMDSLSMCVSGGTDGGPWYNPGKCRRDRAVCGGRDGN